MLDKKSAYFFEAALAVIAGKCEMFRHSTTSLDEAQNMAGMLEFLGLTAKVFELDTIYIILGKQKS